MTKRRKIRKDSKKKKENLQKAVQKIPEIGKTTNLEPHLQNDYTGKVFLGIVLFILASFIFIMVVRTGTLYNMIKNIIENNLGSLVLQNLWNNLLFSIVLTFFAFIFLISLNLVLSKWIKIKKMTIITLCIIILIFFFGFFSINEVIGYNPIKLNLLENYNSLIGRGMGAGVVQCYGENEIYFVNQNITCTYENALNLVNLTINTIIIIEDNSKLIYNGTLLSPLNISFKAPENVMYVYFNMTGFDYYGNQRNLSVGYPARFLTKEEYEVNKRIFLGAMISLIIILFATIPSVILNLKQIWKEN